MPGAERRDGNRRSVAFADSSAAEGAKSLERFFRFECRLTLANSRD